MTPEERNLLERAIEACKRGPAHAAERILLFPQIVELVTTTVAREVTYRREHRAELRRRMLRVREIIWNAKTGVEDNPLGAVHIPELVAALNDLLVYLRDLEETL